MNPTPPEASAANTEAPEILNGGKKTRLPREHEMLIPFHRPEVVLTLPCTMHDHHAFCNPRRPFRFKISADMTANIWHTSG
jgi:hypothetical protein